MMIAHHFGEDVKISKEIFTLSPLKKTAGALPLDLHVLGTPPAFILSQDQTLQKKNLFIASVETDLKKQFKKLTLMVLRSRQRPKPKIVTEEPQITEVTWLHYPSF